MTAVLVRSSRVVLLALCVVWAGLFLAQKINLTTADLGRHLKNGEVIASDLAHPAPRAHAAIFSTNFYSYTHPDFLVPNHHWGSGLLFFAVHRVFGFNGLCLFQLGLLLGAWSLMLVLAHRRGGWGWAVAWSLWLMPVFAARYEIRPEAISVFFSACFIFLLERYAQKKISGRLTVFTLCLIQILWTNLHIYFVLGPLIAAAYALSAFSERSPKSAAHSVIFLTIGAMTVMNPFGIRGALYPLFIFGNYGYRLVENQSVPFLENLKVVLPTFVFFKTASIALLCAAALESLVRRRVPRAQTLLALLFAAAAWRAIRNFQLFALFALPALSAAFAELTEFKGNLARLARNAAMLLGAVAAIVSASAAYGGHPWRLRPDFGLGLTPNVSASTDFFKSEGLKGPLFNNYDIGGYLIYGLWPAEKVFVDNRPEAYPDSFFKNVLIPAQENEERWEKLDQEHHFNVIFFSYHDLTPWAQTFMRRRLDDPGWAPVFADAYAIIFLRRTVENASVIVRRELPRSTFRMTPS